MSPRRPRSAESRKSLIQKIHIAKNQLAFDDDTYRDFLRLHGRGKSSCCDMSVPELFGVFNAFKATGFKVHSNQHPRPSRPYATADNRRLMNKIEALLADSGKSWNYAHSIGHKMYQKQRLQWLSHEQLRGVMIALQKQARRTSR